ncbi:MAG: peptidoglycan-associated lipoprotein [Candidatus Deianiraeaceae bacterium]|jgi:peptidoglycan-associated lipoprotein
MKLKLLPVLVLSTLVFACNQDKSTNGEKSESNVTKKVVSAMKSKPLPSVKSLSTKGFIPDRVFFNFNDDTVQDKYVQHLKMQTEYLKLTLAKNPNAMIVVEGNCDERGAVEYNIALGNRRASATKQLLVEQGVPAKRIKTVSFGKERKLVDGVSAIAYLQNRAALTKIEL